MIAWKKLTPGLLITDGGERVQDGRWLCVVEGRAGIWPTKTMFCNLVDGVWLSDDLGGGKELPDFLSVTHISRVPALPSHN